ncbi:hypothetical protein [Spirosoma validum]|uniref:Uncharacterized protein n=1 Tax=Spirosoma validum TaxID=2771355 RepID=A0A927GEV5_9BACT|nr:hypothetical protein [Spirosoma validum]MBD2755078.1 hypothetical protein [Spirosoma validum]
MPIGGRAGDIWKMAKKKIGPEGLSGFNFPDLSRAFDYSSLSDPKINIPPLGDIKPISESILEAIAPLHNELTGVRTELVAANERARIAEERAEVAETKAAKSSRSSLLATWIASVVGIASFALAGWQFVEAQKDQKEIEDLKTSVQSLNAEVVVLKNQKQNIDKLNSLAPSPAIKPITQTRLNIPSENSRSNVRPK